MTTPPRYLTAAECLTVLAASLVTTDRRRIEFEALSTADQQVLIAQATADIDACLWVGVDADEDQQTRWPRIDEDGEVDPSGVEPETYIDPDPDPPANPAVLYIPAGVRLACAVQAAHRALLAAGLSPTAHLDEAAKKGVTSHSAGGVSMSVDLAHATDPWNALCLEAQKHLAPYRSAGGSMV